MKLKEKALIIEDLPTARIDVVEKFTDIASRAGANAEVEEIAWEALNFAEARECYRRAIRRAREGWDGTFLFADLRLFDGGDDFELTREFHDEVKKAEIPEKFLKMLGFSGWFLIEELLRHRKTNAKPWIVLASRHALDFKELGGWARLRALGAERIEPAPRMAVDITRAAAFWEMRLKKLSVVDMLDKFRAEMNNDTEASLYGHDPSDASRRDLQALLAKLGADVGSNTLDPMHEALKGFSDHYDVRTGTIAFVALIASTASQYAPGSIALSNDAGRTALSACALRRFKGECKRQLLEAFEQLFTVMAGEDPPLRLIRISCPADSPASVILEFDGFTSSGDEWTQGIAERRKVLIDGFAANIQTARHALTRALLTAQLAGGLSLRFVDARESFVPTSLGIHVRGSKLSISVCGRHPKK